MKCTPRLLMLVCLPLLVAKAHATIIIATSADFQSCGGPNADPCPPPPVSTFKGGLIINGDFGDGNFTGFSGTATTNTDRTQGGVQGDANQSHSSAYLASEGSDQTLYQTFATTAGDVYTISFNLNNFNNYASDSSDYDLTVNFGDQILLSFRNPNEPDTTSYLYKATADSSSTTLQFKARNDPGAFFLTDIAVMESTTAATTATATTPEPSSLILLGTGAVSLFGLARRRARSMR